jgi:hypothetical protein
MLLVPAPVAATAGTTTGLTTSALDILGTGLTMGESILSICVKLVRTAAAGFVAGKVFTVSIGLIVGI